MRSTKDLKGMVTDARGRQTSIPLRVLQEDTNNVVNTAVNNRNTQPRKSED